MIELNEGQLVNFNLHSSKGNQLKWNDHQYWYKADGNGYEGLSEYICSKLLKKSNLSPTQFVNYETCKIKYKFQEFNGCKSLNFLKSGERLITLERLYEQKTGTGLNKCIYSIRDTEERLNFIIKKTEEITGLHEFGTYMTNLLEFDMFFLNEDRHTHNLAVIQKPNGTFDYCPLFDNGASLLSDTTLDYPINVDVYKLIPTVKSKLFDTDIEHQAEIAEKLFGRQLKLTFNKKDFEELLENENYYSNEIKERVYQILLEQMRKYSYLF